VRNNGVGSWIARRAGLTPDRAAVFYGDDRLSYAQLHDRVTRLWPRRNWPGTWPTRAAGR